MYLPPNLYSAVNMTQLLKALVLLVVDSGVSGYRNKDKEKGLCVCVCVCVCIIYVCAQNM